MASINDSNVETYLKALKLKVFQKEDQSTETGTANLCALITTVSSYIDERRNDVNANLITLSNRRIVLQGLIKSIEDKHATELLTDRYDSLLSSATSLINTSEYMDLSIGKISTVLYTYTKELKSLNRELREINRVISMLYTQKTYFETLKSDLAALSAKAASI